MERDGPLKCLEKIGLPFEELRLLVSTKLKRLEAKGTAYDDTLEKVVSTISQKTEITRRPNDIITVNEKGKLFVMQEHSNIEMLSIGLRKEPPAKLYWKKLENGKLILAIPGNQQQLQNAANKDLVEQLDEAAKRYLGLTKCDNVDQIKNNIDVCYKITISRIVVIGLSICPPTYRELREHIMIIASLASLLVILTQKYNISYTCTYDVEKEIKKTQKRDDDEQRPEYASTISKVNPLTTQEMRQAVVTKFNKFNVSKYKPTKSLPFKETLKFISLRITNEGKLDQRCVSTRTMKDTGFSPKGEIAPKTFSICVPHLPANIEDVNKEAQDTFIEILQSLNKFPGNYKYKKGYLYLNGRSLSSVDFCNALDAITIEFLGKRPVVKGKGKVKGRPTKDSVRQQETRKKEMAPVVDELVIIILTRIVNSAIYRDDFMSPKGYRIWQKHADMIISFVALLIGVLEYTGCTKQRLIDCLRKSRKLAIRLQEYSGRRHSFPCAHHEYNAGAFVDKEGLVDYKHMRVLEEKLKLDQFQMTTPPTPSNGNCQFYALAEQANTILGRRDTTHVQIRQEVVVLLENNAVEWKGTVNQELMVINKTLKEYRNDMSELGTWGDQISLRAAAFVLGCNIKLISAEKFPGPGDNLPTINLGYIKRMHYYSVKQKVRKGIKERRLSLSSAHREYNAGVSDDKVATYTKHMRDLKMKLDLEELELSTPPTPTNASCQFYALANLEDTNQETTPLEVRKKIVDFLQNNSDEWQEKVKAELAVMDKTLEEYIDELRAPGTWGDEISLKAAAFVLTCNIRLISADRVQPFPGPPDINNLPTINLGYIQWIHYASVKPKEDELVPRQLDMD